MCDYNVFKGVLLEGGVRKHVPDAETVMIVVVLLEQRAQIDPLIPTRHTYAQYEMPLYESSSLSVCKYRRPRCVFEEFRAGSVRPVRHGVVFAPQLRDQELMQVPWPVRSHSKIEAIGVNRTHILPSILLRIRMRLLWDMFSFDIALPVNTMTCQPCLEPTEHGRQGIGAVDLALRDTSEFGAIGRQYRPLGRLDELSEGVHHGVGLGMQQDRGPFDNLVEETLRFHLLTRTLEVAYHDVREGVLRVALARVGRGHVYVQVRRL